MQALDRFLSVYFNDDRVEYKPDLDKIAGWNIPQSLKDIYSFIGKFQGQSGFLCSNQDSLIINPGDSSFGGKLYIVAEHSGCWTCCTEFEGEDPPVWTEDYGWKDDSPKWKLVHKSLSQFLVAFCLEEAIMASKYRSKIGGFYSNISSEKIITAINNKGYDVFLLWQDCHIWHAMSDRPISVDRFFIVEDAILFDGYQCTTNYKNANRLITSIQAEFKYSVSHIILGT